MNKMSNENYLVWFTVGLSCWLEMIHQWGRTRSYGEPYGAVLLSVGAGFSIDLLGCFSISQWKFYRDSWTTGVAGALSKIAAVFE